MKFKTTKKAIMNGYRNTIKIGYCNLAYLLHEENETAYTTRSEGWGADIYSFGDTAIVTGYAPFGNISPDYETQKKYDNQAEKIVLDYSIEWKEKKSKLSDLIEQFITETTKQD